MLLSAMLITMSATTDVDSSIVATSMFKNGYAMVLRDIPVSGSGEIRLSSMPSASLGTLWFAGGEGVLIDSVRTVTDSVTSQVDVSTLGDILNANVGKELRLGVKDGDKVTGEVIIGKLLSASGDILVLKNGNSNVALPKASVSSVGNVSGDLIYKVPSVASRKTLAFVVKGKGHISMISLERGISWAPGYSIDLTSRDHLSLVAKATVLNDDADLKNVTAKFVTGFPNVPFAAFRDPLTSGESIDQFLGLMQSPAGFGGGGGFAQGARAKAMFSNQMAAAAPAMDSISEGMSVSPVLGEQLEDLFFYNQPNVTLDKGERSYYVLFRMEAPYKQIYTCDLPDPVQNNIEFRPVSAEVQPPDVWHTLSFKNTSGKPFTTGPATTFKSGEILGQDTMTYVSPGSDAEIKVTKSLDIRAATTEEEIERVRGAIKNVNNYPIDDLVTVKGTVAVTNAKSESVTMRIRHDYTGELISAEGDPVNKKGIKGLRDINSSGKLTWNKVVNPGQTIILNYTYKLYVKTQ